LLLHNKTPCHFSLLTAVTAGELSALILRRWSDRLDLGTNVKHDILGSSCKVICSDRNSEQTIFGHLEDEKGSDVDKNEENFAVLTDHDSYPEVGAVIIFNLYNS
jgi:hypothetical protein